MIFRRQVILNTLFFLGGCTLPFTKSRTVSGKLTLGVVSYDQGLNVLTQFQSFNDYLAAELETRIELEPAYNEVQALDQINRHRWSLVFAPPGLCAIAIHKAGYIPLFPLQGKESLNSVFVVRKDSRSQSIQALANQKLALGQPGSASAYYMPLYDLYGMTLASIKLAETPEQALEWLSRKTVDVTAMGKDDYDQFQAQFPTGTFRVLYRSHRIPPGSVLLSPKVERNQQRLLEKIMNNVSPAIAASVGYIPNAKPPEYKTLMDFIDKVKPIERNIQSTPVALYSTPQPVKPVKP